MIFSKLQSGYWPNITLVGEKCRKLIEAEKNHSNDFGAFLAGSTPGPDNQVTTTVKKTKSPVRIRSKDAPVKKFQDETTPLKSPLKNIPQVEKI